MSLSDPNQPAQHPFEQPPEATTGEDAASPRSVALTWAITALVIGVLAARFPAMMTKAAVFIATLSVLVFVHEWGHYQFARWAGMKVNRFAIGFPPWIYTKRVNGIDYSIGALPIGGMVDIAGLGSEEEMVATTSGSVVQNATRPARGDVPFGEKQFQDASLGWRFWALFAGPLMNFIFALVVFVAIFSVLGEPIPEVTTTVDNVISGAPASKAKLQQGDKIIAVNGKPAQKPEDISDTVQASNGKEVLLTVLREGKEIKLPLVPVMDELELYPGKVEKRWMIGIQFDVVTKGYKKISFPDAVKSGVYASFDITYSIIGVLQRAATNNLTKSDKRNVGGPLKIAQTIGNSAAKGWQDVLLLAASLSVNLGLMNLLPFPALDGGRILFLGYELVFRRPIDPRKEGLVHTVGIVLLLAFMLLITVHDVLPMIRG